jgi:hypothetical protein
MGRRKLRDARVIDFRALTTEGELRVENNSLLWRKSTLVFILKAISVFEKSIMLCVLGTQI